MQKLNGAITDRLPDLIKRHGDSVWKGVDTDDADRGDRHSADARARAAANRRDTRP